MVTRHTFRARSRRNMPKPTFQIYTKDTQQIASYIESLPEIQFTLSKTTKNVFTELCNQIHYSANHMPTYNVTDIQSTMDTILQDLEHHTMGSFVPTPVLETIVSSEKIGRRVQCTMHGRAIDIVIVIPKPTNPQNEYSRLFDSEDDANVFFENCIRRILIWLNIALRIAGTDCSNTFTCYLFLTENVKRLPKNHKRMYDTREHGDITTNHANTAFTESCTPHSVMVLFRMEEWFKVFIHETFHSLGLDFSQLPIDDSNTQMHTLFPGCSSKMDFRIYETYCEVWAETLNVLFIAYFSEMRDFPKWIQKTTKNPKTLKTSKTPKTFNRTLSKKSNTQPSRFPFSKSIALSSTQLSRILQTAEQMLKHERMFSVFQMAKVLHYHKLSYLDLCHTLENSKIGSPKSNYSEKTQVFSYYIVKPILLFFLNDFVKWCFLHNQPKTVKKSILYFRKTPETVLRYGELIEKLYKQPEFVKTLNDESAKYSRTNTKSQLYQNKTDSDMNIVYSTLRMSLYEMDTI